jgi:hypothetical protein
VPPARDPVASAFRLRAKRFGGLAVASEAVRRKIRAGRGLSATPRTAALVVTALILSMAGRLSAHDIPVSVLVQAFVRPQADHLRLLIRVPLAAMRDVAFPLRGDGLLDLSRVDRALDDAALLWLARDIQVYEEEVPLGPPRVAAARVSLPSDRSFVSYDSALAHVTGPPLPPETTLYTSQALFDVLFEYPIRSDRSTFSIRPGLARLGVHVVTALRYQPPAGAERAFELSGDPGVVRLDPRWHQAAWRFVQLGFRHILDGTDHLLFLLCLVIPFRKFRALVAIVTAFTVAHSITLLASAFDLAPDALWFPPLVETLIAVSILYMALENIVGSTNVQRRWMLAFAFGLVHGFGFSFALRETLQFAGSHLITSLLSFNVGVELGQLLVLAVLVPVLQALFRFAVPERIGTIVLSALVAHTAWHWTAERWERLRQFELPSLTVDGIASGVRWLMAAVAMAAVLWIIAVAAAKRKKRAAVN